MRHPFRLRRIVHLDWHGHYIHSMPRCKHEQFKLCLISAGEHRQTTQFVQGIRPEASLRVSKPSAGLNPIPEIGELVGKRAPSVYIHI